METASGAGAPPLTAPADRSVDPLLPGHREVLADSGISPDVIAERGYRSVSADAPTLAAFAAYQRAAAS